MMWQDNVNGLYEFLGGLFVLLNVLRVYKDKQVRGVSIVATGFFASWGLWNLYYYPHLGQWASFLGGCCIVSMNLLWIGLMLYYVRKG
jgi:hypothetical protein